ncbi:MAG TPA: class I SAM-dependent methyltransferase [Gemmataceae bacterium]|nr:class I SAM-dependent methyltransferase [Gemmataceae bacterium]
MNANIDLETVEGFGHEWSVYDQSALPPSEHRAAFEQYFAVFPWDRLPPGATGFDLGCGSGRWAKLAAPRVGTLHCIDASEAALGVARRNLAGVPGCRFHRAGVADIPLPDDSMDFGYSLGVLHHVPDTEAGIRSCVAKLKPGAPLLLYLYYAFDNRPRWFRGLWRLSDAGRRLICRLPPALKLAATTAIAAAVYYPLARCALVPEKLGCRVGAWPLSYYRDRSFYTMRTDALDRFGTRLERRFTAEQIRTMMHRAGLERITFSPGPPYWCAVGFKARQEPA